LSTGTTLPFTYIQVELALISDVGGDSCADDSFGLKVLRAYNIAEFHFPQKISKYRLAWCSSKKKTILHIQHTE
jgi:hypothetical protein